MPRRRPRLTPEERDWQRRAKIATDAFLEIRAMGDAIACFRCGRTKTETKLWFFATTGEPDAISKGRPAVIVACDEHDPNEHPHEL